VLSPRRVYEFPSKLLGRRDGADKEGLSTPNAVLSDLSQTITAGDYRLDPILVSITETARNLTGAAGAAIAMRKDDRIVCQARCGEGAPPVGASLSPDSGISGQCLRSGLIQHCTDTDNDTRVDAELCRLLGLRSIAVVPIRGWEAINGILEVVSSEPHAFSEQNLVHLQELAALAERARASLPKSSPSVQGAQHREVATAVPLSERVIEFFARSKRNQVAVLAGVALLALLVVAIWLGRRSSNQTNAGVAPAAQNMASNSTVQANDHPVGASSTEAASKGKSKPSAGSPVTLASQVEIMRGGAAKGQTKTSSSNGTVPGNSTEMVVRRQNPPSRPAESAALEPPPMPAGEASSSTMTSVMSPSAAVPKFATPISQVSNGHLIYRVDPIYPAAARELRLQGDVVLAAVIAEDGTVENVKLVKGEPVLAGAAMNAVRRWRYSPYQLNNKPVKVPTEITVTFRLP
jgi:TonB family protein